jgi:hypothetical protein
MSLHPSLPPQGPQAARCAEHGALDCACTDPLPRPPLPPHAPFGLCEVTGWYDHPPVAETQRRVPSRLVGHALRVLRDEDREDFLGLVRVVDGFGEEFWARGRTEGLQSPKDCASCQGSRVVVWASAGPDGIAEECPDCRWMNAPEAAEGEF